MSDIVDALLAALGPEVVAAGPDIDPRYRCDWSALGAAPPLALIRPRRTAEVATTLRLCHEAGQPMVPQGGLTGLAGGATPRLGDIALSLERMSGVEEIDPAAATITLLAGTPLQAAQAAAAAAGFLLALDLGARGSCQIGGNLSTNAGGNRVIRYGMAREQVLGLEVVLADGTVVASLNKMLKNNAGYDIKQLFIGAEGTLGVITRAVLRMHPRPLSQATALVALPDYEAVVRLLRHAQATLGEISGFEALLDAAMVDGLILDGVLAQSERDARDFWIIREGAPIDSFPLVMNFDVSLPIAGIGEFAARCRAGLDARWPQAPKLFYGHIGDSNLHISVMMESRGSEAEVPAVMHAVDAVVYEAVRAMAGSVSAEHGIGTLKRGWLGYSRSEAELALMRLLKQSLDPKGILNPGKVI